MRKVYAVVTAVVVALGPLFAVVITVVPDLTPPFALAVVKECAAVAVVLAFVPG